LKKKERKELTKKQNAGARYERTIRKAQQELISAKKRSEIYTIMYSGKKISWKYFSFPYGFLFLAV